MARNRRERQRPPVATGIAPEAAEATLAPWPVVDKYPIVIGSNLSMAYVSTVARQATTGYRREWVDVLAELLERDPETYAVVQQRVLAVAGGRIEIAPHDLPPGHAEADEAKELADYCDGMVKQIIDLEQSLATLAWAIYYDVSALEIEWDRTGEWRPARLHFIHSRRLSFPDPMLWQIRIWDQGAVQGYDSFGSYPSNSRLWGFAPEDYPGKFIVHMPWVRGDYPTRGGLGRQTVWWSTLKGMAARGAGQFIERFAKPWVLASYSTRDDGTPRAANDTDITTADEAARALGIGASAAATLPDSIKVQLAGPGVTGKSKLDHLSFIDVCNREIRKAVLGQTDTVEGGPNGSRSSTETRKESTRELYRYDARILAATLRRDLVAWIVRLNRPHQIHLLPRVVIHVDERPDPMAVVELAAKAAQVGMPVDADAVADQVGLPLVKRDDPEARRLYPLSPTPPQLGAPGSASVDLPTDGVEPATT